MLLPSDTFAAFTLPILQVISLRTCGPTPAAGAIVAALVKACPKLRPEKAKAFP